MEFDAPLVTEPHRITVDINYTCAHYLILKHVRCAALNLGRAIVF